MADSVSEGIGDLAKTGIEALALTGTPTVVKRKNPGVPEGATIPAAGQISVSVLEDKSQPLDRRRKLKTYTLVAVIVRPGGAKAGDDAIVRDWRERIEEKIDDKDRETFAGLPAGAELNRADYIGGKLPFEPSAAPKDFDFSALSFAVEVIETRAPRT